MPTLAGLSMETAEWFNPRRKLRGYPLFKDAARAPCREGTYARALKAADVKKERQNKEEPPLRFKSERKRLLASGFFPNAAAGDRPSYVQYALSVNSREGIVTINILASRASDHLCA
jgi:hypothetical protein